MPELGTTALLVALVLSLYSILAFSLGAWRRRPDLVESGKHALYLLPLVLALAVGVLVWAFVRHDFSVRYVAEHSSLSMPPIYTWVAFYAGNEGSMLFIALVLAGLSALAVRYAPLRVHPSLPHTASVLALVQFFFLAVMLSLANPFALQSPPPPDGQGINPLLTHPGMFFHPPMLMSGLVMVTLPFAFAMGALLARRTGDEWVGPARVWGLLAWTVLGAGLLLGAWWAYTILGWGGYWAWDPVENAGLMPWLGLTAFVHSLSVQRRRGMFRMWNISLVNITFGLAAFGMFLNRGGPVPSVHSFAASTIGWVFLAFLGFSQVASFGLFFWRYDDLRSEGQLESGLSREASFLGNNLVLLSIAFVTLWGVAYPLISQAFTRVSISVARPFYDKINGPLFLALLALMGVGPLLPWRRASWPQLRRALAVPLSVALVGAAALALAGVRHPLALLTFSLCLLVAAGVVREWARGTWVRARRGEALPLAFLHLLLSNRPRYGGYIAHLALVLLVAGVAGSTFYRTMEVASLAPGEGIAVGPYRVRYLGAEEAQFADHFLHRATVALYRGDRFLGLLYPSQAYYPSFQLNHTRAGIRSTPLEDVYIVASEFSEDESAVFEVRINPMVAWLWAAGPVMLLGTLVSLWPGPARVPATAGVPRATTVASPTPGGEAG